MTDTSKQNDGNLDDKALEGVDGGNLAEGLGFIAGALIGGVVNEIVGNVAHPQPNIVFGAPTPIFAPQPPPVIIAPPPQVFMAPQPAPVFMAPQPAFNSAW